MQDIRTFVATVYGIKRCTRCNLLQHRVLISEGFITKEFDWVLLTALSKSYSKMQIKTLINNDLNTNLNKGEVKWVLC